MEYCRPLLGFIVVTPIAFDEDYAVERFSSLLKMPEGYVGDYGCHWIKFVKKSEFEVFGIGRILVLGKTSTSIQDAEKNAETLSKSIKRDYPYVIEGGFLNVTVKSEKNGYVKFTSAEAKKVLETWSVTQYSKSEEGDGLALTNVAYLENVLSNHNAYESNPCYPGYDLLNRDSDERHNQEPSFSTPCETINERETDSGSYPSDSGGYDTGSSDGGGSD